MKAKDIKVKGLYTAKVSGKLAIVRVDAIREVFSCRPNGSNLYDVTNLTTGRKTTFRSAAKFRKEASPAEAGLRTDKLGRSLADTPREPEEKPARPADFGGQYESPKTTDSGPLTGLGAKLATLDREDDAPHLIVDAKAGTGKTTTLVGGMQVLMGVEPLDAKGRPMVPSPQQEIIWDAFRQSAGKVKTVMFCAFNRSIREELERRVPKGCERPKTLNGLGYSAVLASFKLWGGDRGMNEYRCSDLTAEVAGYADSREMRRKEPVAHDAVVKLVNLCKMNLVNSCVRGADVAALGEPLDQLWNETLTELAAHYEVELNGSRARVFELVPKVLERAKDVAKDGCVDFADQVWLPVVLNLPLRKYDLLLVDEAQDLNRCQQELVKRSGRRLVFCGDPRQAIYGFAGADSESMLRLEQELGQTERGVVKLPLTVTRRCGKAIVKEANRIVAEFEAHDSNPEGVVSSAVMKGEKSGRHYRTMVDDGDFLLCRVNAPLVSECFKFIRAGRKANIQGRDVGKGLITTIKKLANVKGNEDSEDYAERDRVARELAAVKVETVITHLGAWLDDEQRKEGAKKNPSESRMIALQDKHDCILCFTEGAGTAWDMVAKVRSVFTDDKQVRGIRLSSIHKAKGLEAERVFLLEPEGASVPHPMAKSAWQVEQEYNLRYVAITRAIEELVYVS